MSTTRPEGIVAFGVGTGRCGTTFITELLGLEPEVAASHERLRLAACYHMFCKWHGIPSDSEGFLADRDVVVANDLAARRISFEASALLSHSIAELYERYTQLAESRPNTGPNIPLSLDDWPEQGIREFEAEVAPVAEAFGYEYRIAALKAGANPVAVPARDITNVLAALGIARRD